jgi:hypothetical protein
MSWQGVKLKNEQLDEPYVVRWSKLSAIANQGKYTNQDYLVIGRYSYMMRRHADDVAQLLNSMGVKVTDARLKLRKVHWSKFED